MALYKVNSPYDSALQGMQGAAQTSAGMTRKQGEQKKENWSGQLLFVGVNMSGYGRHNILSGEQTILAGADMKPRTVNPRFLAASARYTYKLSDAQNKFISSQVTTKDEFGNETTDPSKGMILEMLMGMFGQSQYAALRAYQEGVLPVVAQLHREDPSIPLAQAQQVASGRYYNWLMQKSKGGQSASKTTPAAQETKPNGNLKVHKKIKDAAAGSNQGAPAGNE